MKLLARSVVAAAIFFLWPGCTRTYISTGDPGVPSPDGDTRLCLTAHGAYGRSYLDRTKKLLDVCIKRGAVTNETILFSRRYKFVGSDLWAHAEWISTNRVTLSIYDYGEDISRYDACERNATSNQIATLSFYLENQTGKFREKR
jgi:hypothetical protein